jgi:hypothetical protein
MEILEHKTQDVEVENFLNIFHLPNIKANLNGSALYKHLEYSSDFDLQAVIPRTTDITDFYPALRSVLQNIELNPNMFFIEMKYETLNNLKIRMHPGDIISQEGLERHYSDLKMVKIDTVALIKNKFYEISCIYSFKDNLDETQQEIIKRIQDDINDLNQGT